MFENEMVQMEEINQNEEEMELNNDVESLETLDRFQDDFPEMEDDNHDGVGKLIAAAIVGGVAIGTGITVTVGKVRAAIARKRLAKSLVVIGPVEEATPETDADEEGDSMEEDVHPEIPSERAKELLRPASKRRNNRRKKRRR